MTSEELKKEINKIIKKVMGHNHMALENKSEEWLKQELIYLKKLYK